MNLEILSANFRDSKYIKIAIIGLGFVGLPLAIEFAKKYKVLGFDIDKERIKQLERGQDDTLESNIENLKEVVQSYKSPINGLHLSDSINDIKECNVFIITVPTPVDRFRSPDLSMLLQASVMVGNVLKKNDIVIYESTVYPGCTEEDCVPELERASGLEYNKHFYVGYSPERISPGDKVNTLTQIKKITSGSNPSIADIVDALYSSIILAGTHKASSIKVAEAAKAIENAQRDLNISFVNELALIFDRIGIDTNDVLEAAGTKWNFLKFKPGLVGGHCIGVDPYYLAHKAESVGYHPQVILSGRRVNDNMGVFIANKVVKLLIKKGHKITNTKALILGVTFKENCPDIRNSKVIDIFNELQQFGIDVDIYDPWANVEQVKMIFNIKLLKSLGSKYDAIILAVAHQEFKKIDVSLLCSSNNSVIYDTKAVLPRDIVDGRL